MLLDHMDSRLLTFGLQVDFLLIDQGIKFVTGDGETCE